MITAFHKKTRRYWQLYVFLAVPLAYVMVFSYYPMLGLQIAFKDYDIAKGIWASPWVGMSHFSRFFSDYNFARVLKNTLSLSFYSIFASFPFPIMFALAINTIERTYFKKTVQTITYMPHFISSIVIVGMLFQIFHARVGLYGIAYKAVWGTMPRDIFAKSSYFSHLYVWSGVWQSFGWSSIIYLAALTSVSYELHEAALVDGATRFQRVLRIDCPALLPTISIMLILRMGSVMSIGFEKIYLMQNTLNRRVSEVISTYVYHQSLGSTTFPDYSYSTAIGLFNSVINLILVLCVNAISNKMSDQSLF